VITYDFPLNERIRTMLRLEGLYARMARFTSQSEPCDHQAAMSVLFEILEVASRAELKADMLQELERQQRHLYSLHDNPQISERALSAILDEIENARSALFAMSGKVGQHLRENEWLMGVKQRAAIPGGTCEFDLPSLHYWLNQDVELRRQCINAWLEPMLPVSAGLSILLKLLRGGGKTLRFVAHHGNFQQMQGGRVAQMLRVRLDSELPCIPEVSANKHVLNIRFLIPSYAGKSVQYEDDVDFDLTFCSL
jgi:cell division protein ZapD